MIKTKLKKLICIICIVFMLIGCSSNNNDSTDSKNVESKSTDSSTEKSDDTNTSDANTTQSSSTASSESIKEEIVKNIETYTEEDLNTNADGAKTTIELNDGSHTINGSGAVVKDNNIVINTAGTYEVSGVSTKSSIIINAKKDDNVHLILNGVDISVKEDSAIYGMQANKTIITLAENSVNKIRDTSNYNESDDSPDSAIFIQDDLTINGSGSLTVQGNYQNAISSKDNLILMSGTYDIKAIKNGIIGRDSLRIISGTYNITTDNDGIKSNNDEDETKGYVYIEDGTFNIKATNDAIQAEKNVIINNGNIDITTEKDGINSNQSVSLNGGNFNIKAKDDGVHANSILHITDGTINIPTSYEGLEGSSVIIDGGTMNITASDDGINSAGGSDNDTTTNDRFKRGMSNYNITINDGTIVVNSEGDGIDANGSLYVNGGTIRVYGPNFSDNTALDLDGEYINNGGDLIATGSSRMMSSPSNTSQQGVITIVFPDMQDVGTAISLKSSNGDEIYNITLTKQCNMIILSNPRFKLNESYTLKYNDSETTITLDSLIKAVSSDGSEINQMRGPGGGGRGGRGGGGRPDGDRFGKPTDGGQRPDTNNTSNGV